MKSSLVAMMEALSQLARKGFRPARTVFLGIGHDEETGGAYGAGGIAKLLDARGVRLGLLWDEGAPILVDGLPGLLPRPLALIGTAEKVVSPVLARAMHVCAAAAVESHTSIGAGAVMHFRIAVSPHTHHGLADSTCAVEQGVLWGC